MNQSGKNDRSNFYGGELYFNKIGEIQVPNLNIRAPRGLYYIRILALLPVIAFWTKFSLINQICGETVNMKPGVGSQWGWVRVVSGD